MNRVQGLASAKPVLILVALLLCLGAAVRDGRAAGRQNEESAARDQFASAVRMRTMLEGLLPRDRSIADYKKTIAAYQKVYQLSFDAPEVTPSLIAEAELYREMGHYYDQNYFQVSIDRYRFLLKEYPGTRYRAEALFTIAQIQQTDQGNLETAAASYKEFLKRYPEGDRAAQARQALMQIAAALSEPRGGVQDASGNARGGAAVAQQRTNSAAVDSSAGSQTAAVQNVARTPASDLLGLGPVLQPHDPQKAWAAVESVQALNGVDHTRIIVRLNDTVTFDSAHLPSPDRIYFDLHQARVSSRMHGDSVDFQSGLLKSMRVGQNKPDVVRIVLDAAGTRDYSAALVGKPYRLIIDLRATKQSVPDAAQQTTLTAAAGAQPATSPAPGASVPVVRVAAETVTVKADKLAPKVAERLAGTSGPRMSASITPPPEPKPTRDGGRSLSRELGLKISRIVIDPGHGGHDTGTIGPHGLMEKDVCLDVALRLGRIIEKNLPGAQVIYTRKDDRFIPLEERTAIANNAKADLFISIHANSSRDHYARGVETYYLNFATSPEAMEVATRENAYSTESIHDLQTLIQKIARNDKIQESKELAGDIQSALSHRLELVSASEHNRGVKRAPFVVLIGANVPSVLCEISFLSNPTDERLLRQPAQRQRIALGIYRGVASYLVSLNSLSYNKQVADDHSAVGSGVAAVSAPADGPGSRN
ncbi:MAG TPA: N-acetylmuramoyl-L-alanine amidase [Candidatus Acidoferrales bacterium]|nr:N-acetylmuramoyl-L-alanine amidase [Candidatus Acidoferrales bacterium]